METASNKAASSQMCVVTPRAGRWPFLRLTADCYFVFKRITWIEYAGTV